MPHDTDEQPSPKTTMLPPRSADVAQIDAISPARAQHAPSIGEGGGTYGPTNHRQTEVTASASRITAESRS